MPEISDPGSARAMIQQLLQPWQRSIQDPAEAQREVLHGLLQSYAKTDYGEIHGAHNVDGVKDYRRAFPSSTYDDYKPLVDRVMAGEIGVLLSEEPVGWAITRGTTAGTSKFIPMTATDLKMRVSAGRAMLNFVAETGRYDLFAGVNLNLNFPSTVGRIRVGDRDLDTAIAQVSTRSSSRPRRPFGPSQPRRMSTPLGVARQRKIGSVGSSSPTHTARI